MVKVSVVIPVYNSAIFLKDCLESLLKQTLSEIEIICINDGSTDNSLEILKSYAEKDERIKVVNKKNEGQSIARNIGINMACGEYLGFVDSDDWVDLDYFEKLYNAAQKYNCDIACAGFKKITKNKIKIGKSYAEEKIYSLTDAKVKADKIPAHNYIWNKIYKRTSWQKEGFKFEPERFFEDMALVIKIIDKLGDMVVVPDTYYNYRTNPNSTCFQKTPKHDANLKWAKNELYKYCEENNIYIDKSKVVVKKEYYKIFNFTLMKIYYYEKLVKFKLFGFIPFGKKVII